MLGAVKSALGLLWGGVKAVNNLFDWFRTKAAREAGANEEKLKSKEQGDEARKRMDAVEPAGDAATRDKLRRKKF